MQKRSDATIPLRKVSFLGATPGQAPTQDPQQQQMPGQVSQQAPEEPITYRDNVISMVQQYLHTQYPWLEEDPELNISEIDPDSSYAIGVGVIPFQNTHLEFPFVYSDGEIMDIPGFYVPEAKLMVPFTEEWYQNLKSTLATNENIGRTIDMRDVTYGMYQTFNPAHSGRMHEFGTKYHSLQSLTNIIGALGKRDIQKYLKTASMQFPELIAPFYRAYKKADLNAKAFLSTPILKTARRNEVYLPIVVKPKPVFTKLSQIMDISDSSLAKLGMSKLALANNLRTELYTIPDSDEQLKYTDEMGDSIKQFISTENEIVDYGRLVESFLRTRIGTTSAYKDIISDQTMLYVCPYVLFRDGNSMYGLNPDTIRDNNNEPSISGSTNVVKGELRPGLTPTPEVTGKKQYATVRNIEYATASMQGQTQNVIVTKLSRKASQQLLRNIMSAPFTIATIVNCLKANGSYEYTELVSKFAGLTPDKIDSARNYGWDDVKILVAHSEKFLVWFPTKVYGEWMGSGFVYTRNQVGNDNIGKLSIYFTEGPDKNKPAEFSKNKHLYDVLYDTQTGGVLKIKNATASYSTLMDKIYAFEPGTARSLDPALIANPDFMNTMKEKGVAPVRSKEFGEVLFVVADRGSSDNMEDLGRLSGRVTDAVASVFHDCRNIIRDGFSNMAGLQVRSMKGVVQDASDRVYALTYLRGIEPLSEVKLSSRKDLAIALGTLGFSQKQTSAIIKKADVTSDYTIGIQPNAQYAGGADAAQTMMPQQGAAATQALEQAQAPGETSPQQEEYATESIRDQIKMLFDFVKTNFEKIDQGMQSRDEVLKTQLAMQDQKIETMSQMQGALSGTPAPAADAGAAPAEGQPPAPQGAATLDDETAGTLAAALSDPNAAQSSGVTPEAVQGIQAALNGDTTKLQELGLNESDLNLIKAKLASAPAQGAAPAAPAGPTPAAAPAAQEPAGAPAPTAAPAQSAAPQGQAPAQGAAPQDQGQTQITPEMQQKASQLVEAVMDSSKIQQYGFTPQDVSTVAQVIANPDQAVQQGEDPTFVQLLMDAYQQQGSTNTMQNTAGAVQGAQPASMPVTQEAQPFAQNLQENGMEDTAQAMTSAAALLDILPRIRTSKQFFKYAGDFKKMLSILGEILLAFQIKSSQYKTQLGQDAYDNTLLSLRKLYEEFGDFVLKMYTVENPSN